jgi:glycosyltransferase involved in cell wall biosynthesis
MNVSKNRPRVAVLSPFIDKHHGTERIIAEWISRLASSFEIHLYSQRVTELDLSQITWHRVPEVPGPHLLNYLWWFAANHLWRLWDRHVRGVRYDLVFTPGINCLDADVISVHIVFAEYCRLAAAELSLRNNPVKSWPRLLHRKLYYKSIIALERRIYSNPKHQLILIAKKTADDLKRHYDRQDAIPIVYVGLNHEIFNHENRLRLRAQARETFQLSKDAFVLLLIGNDWKKKGLDTLLLSLTYLRDLPVVLLVAGHDNTGPYKNLAAWHRVEAAVKFLPTRPDVVFYYSAADANVGPSLEDTFALPTAEAMACGLPVITSLENGTSEIIADGRDGLLLRSATDAGELAEKIRELYSDRGLCERLGENGSKAVASYTWENNVLKIGAIFNEVCLRKGGVRYGEVTEKT